MRHSEVTHLHSPSLQLVTPTLVNDLNLAIALHFNNAVATQEANASSIASDGPVAIVGEGRGLPSHLEGRASARQQQRVVPLLRGTQHDGTPAAIAYTALMYINRFVQHAELLQQLRSAYQSTVRSADYDDRQQELLHVQRRVWGATW